MPTALYSIYATVGLHVTVPHMPVLQLYESLTHLRVRLQAAISVNMVETAH